MRIHKYRLLSNRRFGFAALGACSVVVLLLSPCHAGDRDLTFITEDRVRIHTLFCQGEAQPKTRLMIIAPGYAQHSGTRAMRTLAMALTATADVAIVDFRGNGQSEGAFTFGAREYLDLGPVLRWSSAYPDVTLLGFSLGAYHSIRAAQAYPEYVRRLLLVSCPTCVEEVVLSGGAFLNPPALLFRRTRFQYPPENDLFFRWAWPFSSKPDSTVTAARLDIPCHFLVGGKDTLVFERLSRKVFAAVPGSKTYIRMEHGVHAEGMFLQFPDDFTTWVEERVTNAAERPAPDINTQE